MERAERADLLLPRHPQNSDSAEYISASSTDSDYIPIDEEDEDSDTDSDDSSSYRDSNKPSPAAMMVIVPVRDFGLQTWLTDTLYIHISVRENYYVMRPAEKNMPRCCDANSRLVVPVFVLVLGITRNTL